MNYTIHLTGKCNLNCKYCYENKNNDELSLQQVKNVFDLAIKDESKKSLITFYGGEPLLKKDLIYKSIEYAKKLEKENDFKFYYRLNTNGILLDDEFIKFAKENFINITYSIDGNKESHDSNRINKDGNGSFDIVNKNAKKLLESQPYTIAMMVITLNNVENLYKNVEYIFSIGFKYVICALDYTANWNDESLIALKNEYKKLSDLYYEKTLKEDCFYLMPFENKMDMHIMKFNEYEELCQLGLKSVNIGPDGKIYPCIQFVGFNEFEIGDCKTGIDLNKRQNLVKRSCKEHEVCKECAIKNRCRHSCGCINFLTTGNINEPSALICETERILIEITDKLAEKLYKKRANGFIQKKYNRIYPLIELFELER